MRAARGIRTRRDLEAVRQGAVAREAVVLAVEAGGAAVEAAGEAAAGLMRDGTQGGRGKRRARRSGTGGGKISKSTAKLPLR